jgi:uncharacterized protein (DUF697 family)
MSQYEWETGYEFEYAPGELQYGAGEMEYGPGEMELEEFLGDIVKSVAKAAGGFIRSPVGQALTGVLKTAAKRALPLVGGAVGSFIAPGVGTALGSKLGSMASNLFELELEGMDHEQAEFEVARKVVQLTAAAAQNAALAPPNAPAPVVAQNAIASAAQRYAPGLLPLLGAGPPAGMPMPGGFAPPPPPPFYGGAVQGGRWVRRGRKIVLFGV